MITQLPNTTTREIEKRLLSLRDAGSSPMLGRVLTLVVNTDEIKGSEDAIISASEASHEHPCRVIVVIHGNRAAESRLDAEIRVGGDAGSAEIVVLRLTGSLADHPAAVITPLLLPDTPIVAWWPRHAPASLVDDPIGKLALRRITNADATGDPLGELRLRRKTYSPGDTDLGWSQLTYWRALLAATLDNPPYEPITRATVCSPAHSASADLAAGWLATRLNLDVIRAVGPPVIRLERASGNITLRQDSLTTVLLEVDGLPASRAVLHRRLVSDCLAEELRRLSADAVYAEALQGLPRIVNADASSR